MYALDDFIRKHDEDNTVKKAIANCITENITKEVALDTLAEDLKDRLYGYIYQSDDLDIDDGSNVERDFTKAIRGILGLYFEESVDSEGDK